MWSTLASIFGGCCSNAITLEQVISTYPNSGTLITFCGFLLISLHGLPRHITFYPESKTNSFQFRSIPFPRLKPRKIPLGPYLIQVALFYLISLINNAVFRYHVPMTVHIIFRSGGLVVSMLLGWAVVGRKYNIAQVTSVLLVTLGVLITTSSTSQPNSLYSEANYTLDTWEFAIGIALLSLALLLSGILGLVQDWTYTNYRHSRVIAENGTPDTELNRGKGPPPWQESMFYLHFLGLPLFIFVRKDIVTQFYTIHSGPKTSLRLPLFPYLSSLLFTLSDSSSEVVITTPQAYIPLLLNTLSQLICISGVHKLTTSVSSLTVTLILVVRKAASLIISALCFEGAWENVKMWGGAALVLFGTVGYSIGSGNNRGRKHVKIELKME